MVICCSRSRSLSHPTTSEKFNYLSIDHITRYQHYNVRGRADQGHRQDHKRLLQEREQGGGKLQTMNVLAKHAGQEMIRVLKTIVLLFFQSILSKIEQEVDKSAKDKPQV